MTTETKLKPCRNCGSKECKLQTISLLSCPPQPKYWIKCSMCNHCSDEYSTEKLCIDEWNDDGKNINKESLEELVEMTKLFKLAEEKMEKQEMTTEEMKQRRIAQVLDTIDDVIRKTEELIAKLKQMKQGLLHDLLTRGVDDNGELRDPERHPELFQDSVLGRIPKGWDVERISFLLEHVIDFRGRTPLKLGMTWGGEILESSSAVAQQGTHRSAWSTFADTVAVDRFGADGLP